LAKAVPIDPRTHCTRRRVEPRDRQTDGQTPLTSVPIVCSSCIRCSLTVGHVNAMTNDTEMFNEQLQRKLAGNPESAHIVALA